MGPEAYVGFGIFALILLGVFWVVRLAWLPRGGRMPRCRRCGYPIYGLPGPRCPECGASLFHRNAVSVAKFGVLRSELAAAVWGFGCFLLVGLRINGNGLVHERDEDGYRTLAPRRSAGMGGPTLGVCYRARYWRVAFMSGERLEIQLRCRSTAGAQATTIQDDFDVTDQLVVVPPGSWTTTDPSGEIVKWYGRHGGSLDAQQGDLLWQWAHAMADNAVKNHTTQLLWSMGFPSGHGFDGGGGSGGSRTGMGPLSTGIDALAAALWCAGAYYIYARARRRAGRFADEEGLDFPLANRDAAGALADLTSDRDGDTS